MIGDSDTITLPVGLKIDGEIYREVTIEEMNGYDEENMANRAHRNNGAKVQTMLLRRCIQEIKGLVPKKNNPNDLIKAEYVLDMTTYDRDYLFFCIRALGGSSNIDFALECDVCGESTEVNLNLGDLAVYDWEGDTHVIPFEMDRGIFYKDKMHSVGEWHFMTGRMQEKLALVPQEKILTTSMSWCVKKLGEMDIQPTEEMFRRLSVRERMSLMEQIGENSPGVQTTYEHECGCGATSHVQLDVMRFFKSPTQKEATSSKRGKNTLRKRREH